MVTACSRLTVKIFLRTSLLWTGNHAKRMVESSEVSRLIIVLVSVKLSLLKNTSKNYLHCKILCLKRAKSPGRTRKSDFASLQCNVVLVSSGLELLKITLLKDATAPHLAFFEDLTPSDYRYVLVNGSRTDKITIYFS